jgi:alkylated DNA repair dioxygenase AlkB
MKSRSHVQSFSGSRDLPKLGAGDSYYLANVMGKARDVDRMMLDLLKEVEFVQMYNITKAKEAVPIPRYVSAQCDAVDSAHYRMPGCNQCNIPKGPWTPTVQKVREAAMGATGLRGLNHCVITCYPDERGSLAHHHDNLLDLTPGTGVVSVSFGAVRAIDFHSVDTTAKQTIHLAPGSLLYIGKRTNQQFTHAIPKTLTKCGPRISLTFRDITAKTPSTTDTSTVTNSDYPSEDYPFIPTHRHEWYPEMETYHSAMRDRIASFIAEGEARASLGGEACLADLLPPESEDE